MRFHIGQKVKITDQWPNGEGEIIHIPPNQNGCSCAVQYYLVKSAEWREPKYIHESFLREN